MNDHDLSWRDRLQFDRRRRPMPLIRTLIVSVFWISVTALWLGFTR
jgi:hypothetical protein